ncbi:CPBP family glutamic-type intramembrane protease [Sorangium sp. So ce131]|uniref:CPBP family glutamic-type intramembrane protease n=1 Tax=Sorangium sp. So ce131 TaxID=3133282 RepID=UPI003F5F04B8
MVEGAPMFNLGSWLVAHVDRVRPLAEARPRAVEASSSALASTLLRALFPVAAFVALAPLLWLFFRRTWRELDVEAHEHQRRTLAAGGYDRRPAVLFTITAVVLMLQQYYGGRTVYDEHIRPWLREIELAQALAQGAPAVPVSLRRYDELYSYVWWSFTRVFGYVAIPMVAWKLCFPKDSLLDMGLRVRGLAQHAWIYLLCLAVVVPAVFIVASAPDFGAYYPFYKQSSRSWFDLIAWEAMYFAQFFALEIFFRGFWLAGLRHTLGSGAIFAMIVPYCMIHFGKPYLEAAGAVVAGIALGSLAMRTRSIYSGFLVHVTIALLMDIVALSNRGALPRSFWGT